MFFLIRFYIVHNICVRPSVGLLSGFVPCSLSPSLVVWVRAGSVPRRFRVSVSDRLHCLSSSVFSSSGFMSSYESLNPNAIRTCESCKFFLRASVRSASPLSDRENGSSLLNLFKTFFPHRVITPDRVNFLTALE